MRYKYAFQKYQISNICRISASTMGTGLVGSWASYVAKHPQRNFMKTVCPKKVWVQNFRNKGAQSNL